MLEILVFLKILQSLQKYLGHLTPKYIFLEPLATAAKLEGTLKTLLQNCVGNWRI